MGFIKAFGGALSSTFADQWKEFYGPKKGVSETAAIFQAVQQTSDGSQNTKGNENIITNGSKIMVYEGTALVTMQDGGITGFIAEPGGYIFQSDDPNSKSLFSGGGLIESTIVSSWDKFKFGGQAGAQQTAFYVNLKEIPRNRFGTQDPVAFFDNFLATQVSVITRGTYTIKITDPLSFIKNFVPTKYLEPNGPAFDFQDDNNDAAGQLFDDVVDSLSGALSAYTSDPEKQGSLIKVQSDKSGFAASLSAEVENAHQWKSNRGLEIVDVTLASITYDEQTQELLKEIQQDDKEIRKAMRMGQAYSNNMAGMVAADSGAAMKAAAGNENGAMMGFMGMNMATMQANNMMEAVNQVQQPAQPAPAPAPEAAAPAASGTDKLLEMKKLLDAGAITQEEYDKVKAQVLGI